MAENELPKCLLAIFKKINQNTVFDAQKGGENHFVIK
jgi:hypothetical protein